MKRFLADFVPDALAHSSPMINRSIETERFHAADGTVKGGPDHHLRMGVLAPSTTNFPDATVGFAPNLLKMLEQLALHRPTGLVDGKRPAVTLIKRVHQLPVDIELQLP